MIAGWGKAKVIFNSISSPEWTSYRLLVIGFAFLIGLGTLILSLPISSATEESLSVIDALFTATSAVCVTGLTIADTGSRFSLFGQIVIIVLIQVGGLGIMTATTLIALLLRKRIQLRERLTIQESFNHITSEGLVRLVLYVIKVALLIEFIGGTILAIFLFSEYGWASIYMGYWHGISAFCNAGFDVFGRNNSFESYVGNIGINLTAAMMIILGGLGFSVIDDVWRKRAWKSLETHSKLVLSMTAFLLILGTIGIYFLEIINSSAMAHLSSGERWVASFFQSTSTRTAGIATVNISELKAPTLLLMLILMFIGASPGSTGGGIKTTTFGVVLASVWTLIRGKEDIELFYRRVSLDMIYRSFAIVMVALSLIFIMTGVLMIVEDKDFLFLLFEVTSAFGTVGLSASVTPTLSPIGKLIIIITMFAGRVGTLTVLLSLTLRHRKGNYRYTKGRFRIG